MAAIVYQGLQSCLESSLVTEPRALRLKLHRPHRFSQPLDYSFTSCFFDCPDDRSESKSKSNSNSNSNAHDDETRWSFLQLLSLQSKQKTELIQHSVRHMSEKSLELCTENLGNETGSEETMSECSALEKKGAPGTEKSQKLRQTKTPPTFPPPLTTIRGPECLRIRAHREEGRLVIKATETPSPHTCFQAHRSNGRLRLSFFKISDMENEFQCENCSEEEEEDKRQHGIGRCKEGISKWETS